MTHSRITRLRQMLQFSQGQLGISARRIARETGLDNTIVSRFLRGADKINAETFCLLWDWVDRYYFSATKVFQAKGNENG